jgi:hypothetical protein
MAGVAHMAPQQHAAAARTRQARLRQGLGLARKRKLSKADTGRKHPMHALHAIIALLAAY